jgi:hypothetical protein
MIKIILLEFSFLISKHRSHSMTEVNQYPACRSPRTSVPGVSSPARTATSRPNTANAANRENPIEGSNDD